MQGRHEFQPELFSQINLENLIPANHLLRKIDRVLDLLIHSKIPDERTVIVGDTLHDLDVGKFLNIDVILLSHGHQSVSRLRSKYSVVLEM